MKNWIEQVPVQLQLTACPMDTDKGQHLFRFGDEVTAVYRILKGEVCLTRFSPDTLVLSNVKNWLPNCAPN
jgi:CRP-like cAMP-binding protein